MSLLWVMDGPFSFFGDLCVLPLFSVGYPYIFGSASLLTVFCGKFLNHPEPYFAPQMKMIIVSTSKVVVNIRLNHME